MVGVDTGSLYSMYRRTHSLSRLAWSWGQRRSAAAWRRSTFIKWTGWTLAMALSWWQHHKHCLGIIINHRCLKLGLSSLFQCHVTITLSVSIMMILQFFCLLLRILLLKFSGVTYLWSLNFADTWCMMVNIEINNNNIHIYFTLLWLRPDYVIWEFGREP